MTGVSLLIDLAADSNGRLLAIDALVGETRHLYQLDPQTGHAPPILDLGTSSMIAEGSMAIHQGTNAALAYDPRTDTLYLAATGLASIYSVDPQTARATPAVSIPFTQSPGLTYAQVPEPAGLLSAAGLMLLGLRRRIRLY